MIAALVLRKLTYGEAATATMTSGRLIPTRTLASPPTMRPYHGCKGEVPICSCEPAGQQACSPRQKTRAIE